MSIKRIVINGMATLIIILIASGCESEATEQASLEREKKEWTVAQVNKYWEIMVTLDRFDSSKPPVCAALYRDTPLGGEHEIFVFYTAENEKFLYGDLIIKRHAYEKIDATHSQWCRENPEKYCGNLRGSIIEALVRVDDEEPFKVSAHPKEETKEVAFRFDNENNPLKNGNEGGFSINYRIQTPPGHSPKYTPIHRYDGVLSVVMLGPAREQLRSRCNEAYRRRIGINTESQPRT